MWAPDFAAPRIDPPNTAPAVLPGLIAVAASDGGPLHRIRLAPYGAFQDRDGGGSWTLNGLAHAREVIEATRAYQRGEAMVVDYDHGTLLVANPPSRMAGAINVASLTAEPDGIYGNVSWTEVARVAIRSKEYAYHASHVIADKASGRIVRLAGAGLTNSSTGLAMQAKSEINSREGSGNMGLSELERSICAKLGLSEAAFLEQKRKQPPEISAVNARIVPTQQGVVTKEEAEVLSKLGRPKAAYLKCRDE
jgi:phage I-like protein